MHSIFVMPEYFKPYTTPGYFCAEIPKNELIEGECFILRVPDEYKVIMHVVLDDAVKIYTKKFSGVGDG